MEFAISVAILGGLLVWIAVKQGKASAEKAQYKRTVENVKKSKDSRNKSADNNVLTKLFKRNKK